MSLGNIESSVAPQLIIKEYLGIELTETHPCIEVSGKTNKLIVQKLLPNTLRESQITEQQNLIHLVVKKLQKEAISSLISKDLDAKANVIFSQAMQTMLTEKKIAPKDLQAARTALAEALEKHLLRKIEPLLPKPEKNESNEVVSSSIKTIHPQRSKRRMSTSNMQSKEIIQVDKTSLHVPSISDMVLSPHTPKIISPNTREDISSHINELKDLESRFKKDIMQLNDESLKFCRYYWNEVYAKNEKAKKIEKRPTFKDLKVNSQYDLIKEKELLDHPLTGLSIQTQICSSLSKLPEWEALGRDISRLMQFVTISNDEFETLCSLLKISPNSLAKNENLFEKQTAHFLRMLKIFINYLDLEKEEVLCDIEEEWKAIVEEEGKTLSNESFEFACASILKKIATVKSLNAQRLIYLLATLNQQMYSIPSSSISSALQNIEYKKGEKSTKFSFSFTMGEIQLIVQKVAVPAENGNLPKCRIVIENRMSSRTKMIPVWTSNVKIKIHTAARFDRSQIPADENEKIRSLVVEPLRKIGLHVEFFDK